MWIKCDWGVNKGVLLVILFRVGRWRIEYCVNFCRWIPLDWHQIWASTRHIYRRFIIKFSSVLSKFKQHYIFLSSQISWHHCFGNRDTCFDDETTGQWRLSPGKITLHTCHNMMTSWQWWWHAQAFRMTGPLWVKSSSHRWMSLTNGTNVGRFA